MNREDKIKALMELDGVSRGCWVAYGSSSGAAGRIWVNSGWNRHGATIDRIPEYLDRYDDIILLVQKQPIQVQRKYVEILIADHGTYGAMIRPSPEQLATALIKSIGKYSMQ